MPEDFLAKLFEAPDVEVIRHGPQTCQPIESFIGADGEPKLKAYGRCVHCKKIVLTGEFVWFQTLAQGQEVEGSREVAHLDCDTRAIAEELSYTLSGRDSAERYVLMQGGVGITSGSLVEIGDFLERIASRRR